MQKENSFFFSFPSASNFGEAKVTKSRAQNKETRFFFCRDGVSSRLLSQNYKISLKRRTFWVYKMSFLGDFVHLKSGFRTPLYIKTLQVFIFFL